MRPAGHYLGTELGAGTLSAAPPMVDNAGSTAFPFYGNDKRPCCTVSSLYDRLTAFAAIAGKLFAGTDEQAIADWQAMSGWDGVDNSPTDRGLMMIDVLTRAKAVGIGGSKILGFAPVDHTNYDLMRQVCNSFGCVYVGAELPKATDTQGDAWEMPPLAERTPDDEPQADRGHAFIYTGFDRLHWQVTTYATSKIRASNEWHSACVDEAWAIVDQALIDAAPAGLNVARILADLATLG